MDQCKHCLCRGDLEKCFSTVCSYHELWMTGELKKGLAAVSRLIAESYGVTGLHLNGDDAPWDELRTGGHYEEWLKDFDSAIERKEGGNHD
jgi:hypothetical protein